LLVPASFAVVALVVAACSNDISTPSSPLAPAGRPHFESGPGSGGTLATPELALGLFREKALLTPVSVTKVIPNTGGKIDISEADFSLEIPRGAFAAKSMKITVTALAGRVVAYDFQPHGTVFTAPLRFVQKTGHTNADGVTPTAGFTTEWYGAYFASGVIDPATGIAAVNELLPIDLSAMWTREEISFKVWHFSGYMISTGRQCDPNVEECP